MKKEKRAEKRNLHVEVHPELPGKLKKLAGKSRLTLSQYADKALTEVEREKKIYPIEP